MCTHYLVFNNNRAAALSLIAQRLSLVQAQPQRHCGQHVHCNNHSAHQHHVVGQIGLVVDQHFSEEDARILKVTVEQRRRVWTLQVGSVHAVHGVQRTMEGRSKVANVPHPAEHRSDVHIPCAEAEHGEQNGKDGTDEDSDLVGCDKTCIYIC